MAKLKEYYINYEIKTYTPATICIEAESKAEAYAEFTRIVAHEDVKYEENEWIDEDVLFDVEWSIETV